MKTKAQLVEEILSLKDVDTKANLMKLSLAKLEALLSELEYELVSEPEQVTEAPQMDMKALMEQMKTEMMAELKEQARKEVEAELKASEVKTPTSKPVSNKVEIDRFEMIPVMNATNGSLVYFSRKTGAEWNWSEYGDIEYMEYQELLSMRTAHRRFFDEPFILVMDDVAVESLGLTKMYENIKSPEQIDVIFRMNQAEFEEVVEKSPKGIKHLIISRAKKLYDSGELDSVKKINFMNTRFQTDIGQRG
ncbi:hypothetical protein BSK59_15505 [Paenibacillus odorifer]|uniref:hypothetical protein n=1 Tax=Paenibacillus odorifer TaxID=189426 RepID=UPI00096CB3EB|nr:hypothetical protein [Paenibacillus odorifer]OME53985.1 hypothetical protein BSK59_15505 [Paenibacillus odorifer]